MQSTQFDYFPILMQLILAVGFVVGTIIISNYLGPKRSSVNKDKNNYYQILLKLRRHVMMMLNFILLYVLNVLMLEFYKKNVKRSSRIVERF